MNSLAQHAINKKNKIIQFEVRPVKYTTIVSRKVVSSVIDSAVSYFGRTASSPCDAARQNFIFARGININSIMISFDLLKIKCRVVRLNRPSSAEGRARSQCGDFTLENHWPRRP
ncbi:MAG: hypothetical protein ACRCYL_16455, partial [Kluyvera sp.]